MPLNIYGEQTPENPASKLAPPPADLGSNTNPGGVPRRGLILGGQSVVAPAPVQSSITGSLYGRTQIPAVIPDTELSNAYNPTVTGSQNDIIGSYRSDLRTQQEQLQNLDNTFAQNYSNLPQYNPQEDYNTLFKTAGVSDLYGQQTTLEGDLSKVRDAARALEDEFNNLSQDQEGQGGFANIVAGRQARLAKELGRRLQPLQRQEQLLVDRSNALTNRIKAVKDDIAQQISLGQQNYQNTMSANDQKLKLFGLQRDAKSEEIKNTREDIKMVQDQLNKQLELAQKNRLDPLEVIKTMLLVPEGISFQLADGTTVTGLKTDKPNIKQLSYTNADGRVTVVGLDENTGQRLYSQDLGIIDTPKSSITDVLQKIVKINGTDYVQNPDGTYTIPEVPAVNQEASALQKQALDSAQALLDRFNKKNGTTAVGGSGIFQLQRIPGTPAYGFKTDFDNLKALLSLDNIKLLKGQGAVSDAERQLLADASSKLNLGLSEAEFKTTLENLVKSLSAIGNSTQNTNLPTPPAGSINVRDKATGQYGSLPEGEFDPNKYEKVSFNQGGNTKASAAGSISIPKKSRLAYVNNNPGNLRYVGQAGAQQGTGGFAFFKTVQDGFNALVNQVKLDASRNHTLASFINKYAPPSENDTGTYQKQLAQRLGVPLTTPIKQIDPILLAKEIARKESSTTIG